MLAVWEKNNNNPGYNYSCMRKKTLISNTIRSKNRGNFLLIVVLADEPVHYHTYPFFSLVITVKSEFFYRSVKLFILLGSEISVGSDWSGNPLLDSWLSRKTKYLISNLLKRKALPLNLVGKDHLISGWTEKLNSASDLLKTFWGMTNSFYPILCSCFYTHVRFC
mgnify:FL=1